MKTAKGIKTVRKTTDNKVFNDYGKVVNEVLLYVITELSGSDKGFKMSFRTYSETFENGGFETTLWIGDSSIKNAEQFLMTPSKAKIFAPTIGATLVQYKTNNKLK